VKLIIGKVTPPLEWYFRGLFIETLGCDENCLECRVDDGTCTKCNDGFFLFEKINCLLNCPLTFIDDNGTCVSLEERYPKGEFIIKTNFP
jgi:hypothetical protein